jgi:hypothetical protein
MELERGSRSMRPIQALPESGDDATDRPYPQLRKHTTAAGPGQADQLYLLHRGR